MKKLVGTPSHRVHESSFMDLQNLIMCKIKASGGLLLLI